MERINKISYQNRFSRFGDLPTVPKLIIANHFLKKISGLGIGDKIRVEYSLGKIIISKIK